MRPALVLAMMLSFAVAGMLPTGRYRLLAQRSQLSIVLRKGGLLSALADNHVIVAGEIQGTARSGPEGWSGEIKAPVAALEVRDPGRSAKDRHEIWVTMEGPEQLDAAQYPTIVWRLDSLTPTDTSAGYMLHGSFTMHGVTRTVGWPTHVEIQSGAVHVWGQAVMKLTDFGIHPIHRALGMVQVRDEFQMKWDTYWEQ